MEECGAPGFPLLEEVQAVSVLRDGGFGAEVAVYEAGGAAAGVEVAAGVAVGGWGVGLLGILVCEVVHAIGVGEVEG